MATITFGAHAGKTPAEIPLAYLAWLQQTPGMMSKLGPELAGEVKAAYEHKRRKLETLPHDVVHADEHDKLADLVAWLAANVRDLVRGDRGIHLKTAAKLELVAATADSLARALMAIHRNGGKGTLGTKQRHRQAREFVDRLLAMPSRN
jgi:hypothetical protein